MTDQSDNHTLRLLRRISQKVTGLDLKLDVLTNNMHRIEAGIGVLCDDVLVMRWGINHVRS